MLVTTFVGVIYIASLILGILRLIARHTAAQIVWANLK